jgi:DNA (cytosine-5)-methyltransferase 1
MTEPQAFSENQRGELWLSDHMPQLTTGGGKPGQGYPAVLEPIAFNAKQDGGGASEVAPTLRAGEHDTSHANDGVMPAVLEPLAFHITQDPISSVEACPSLGHKSTGQGIQTATQVRRLTPVECERLMGWPDDHTRYRADGTEVADSHRYRMCGNGVASPVAEWVAGRINAAIADEVTP